VVRHCNLQENHEGSIERAICRSESYSCAPLKPPNGAAESDLMLPRLKNVALWITWEGCEFEVCQPETPGTVSRPCYEHDLDEIVGRRGEAVRAVYIFEPVN
jgi:hypothetical protein